MLSDFHDISGARGAATRPPRASPILAEEAPAVRHMPKPHRLNITHDSSITCGMIDCN